MLDCFITAQEYLKVTMMFAVTAVHVCNGYICDIKTEKVNMMLYVLSTSVSEGCKCLIKEHQIAFRQE